eukprot:1147322-Pelagomonas_calceolata.AAC.18
MSRLSRDRDVSYQARAAATLTWFKNLVVKEMPNLVGVMAMPRLRQRLLLLYASTCVCVYVCVCVFVCGCARARARACARTCFLSIDLSVQVAFVCRPLVVLSAKFPLQGPNEFAAQASQQGNPIHLRAQIGVVEKAERVCSDY